MLVHALFLSVCLWGSANCANTFCYNAIVQECATGTYTPVCTSIYGNFPEILSNLQLFTNTHLERSMQSLRIATHYQNYQKARPGFACMFEDFSDTLWDQTIDLLVYISNRGAAHNFANYHVHDETSGNFEMDELESLAWMLDAEKHLAQNAMDLDTAVGGTDPRYHDADLSFYLHRYFAARHRKNVRMMAGHYVQLEVMSNDRNQMLALYEFDDFLANTFCDAD